MNKNRRFKKLTISLAVSMMFAAPAMAQMATATIKGQLTQAGSPATSTIEIIATNKATGFTYRATTNKNGGYVLNGLAPGEYVLSIAGSKEKSQAITVQVGETSTLDLALGSAASSATQTVQITSSVQRADVINSQVGTSVATIQIEDLPQTSRNFMSFADLAPGVRFQVDPNHGYGTLQSGTADPSNTNVFIDGVSQKNDMLGGMTGTQNSRGNPFPQSAIGEYQVISQNYKAEYDKVSSVALTVVTKSGTNDLHGEVFWDRTGSDMTANSPFQKQSIASGNPVPPFTVNEYGFTLGGPIKEDVAHFFISYEGKDIGQPYTTVLNSEMPHLGTAASVYSMAGSVTQPMKEDLLFGKVDVQIDSSQRLEISARVRKESDVTMENVPISVLGNTQNEAQSEGRFNVLHAYTGDNFLNEAKFGWEYYHYNPHSDSNTPEIDYFYSTKNTIAGDSQWAQSGGSPNDQSDVQRAYTLQDDLTFTGIAGHNIKGGAKLKALDNELGGTYRLNPVYSELLNNTTGNPILGLNSSNPTSPYFQTLNPVPITNTDYHDNQFGLYLQDDWEVNGKLELNYGMRWDYESNMLDNGYATPADRVAMLLGLDTRTGAPAGQTYAQSLAKGGININNYIANGSSVTPFKGAFAPRLGFSYDLNGDKQTVFFGGVGRSYDRSISNYAMQEKQNNAAAGGDTYLIDRTDIKMPFSDQFSLGLRQAVGRWNAEGGLTYVDNKNQFQWFNGNRDPNGGTNGNPPFQPYWGSLNGFGNLILGNFGGEDKTSTEYIKIEKPWTKTSGWTFGATLTHSHGETNNSNWTTNNFNWSGGFPGAPFYPDVSVEKWRMVASGLTDGLLPYGIMVSGKLTWGSGLPFQATNGATNAQFLGTPDQFRQFDLGLSKQTQVWRGNLIFRADILNLFNTVNYGGYNSYDCPTCNYGVPNSMGGPMRTLKMTLRYTF